MLALVAVCWVSAAGAAVPSTTSVSTLRANLERATVPGNRLVASWALARALIAQGSLHEAERILRDAATLPLDEAQRRGNALRLATVLTGEGKVDEAREQLVQVRAGQGASGFEEKAALANAEGALATRAGDAVAAEAAYATAVDEAQLSGNRVAEVAARVNVLRSRMDRTVLAELEPRLEAVAALADTLATDDESLRLRIAVGELHARAVREFKSPVALRQRAYGEIQAALANATRTSTRAEANGRMGELYEDEGRLAEALLLTQRAVSLAQAANEPDQLYRWEWQTARIETRLGHAAAAARATDRALFALSGIRNDVLQSSRQAYASRVEPVYLAYADAHLRTAADMADGSPEQQRVLRDVREQLESLKQAEVQDYFDSGCVVSTASESQGIRIPGVAVVYPILLPDRTEVLVETGGRLKRFSAKVSRGELTATVRRLRNAIERSNTGDAYVEPAAALYRWLLADAMPWLESEKIDTLVYVPVGPLRTVPLAVLNDGHQFVIERFAVATTPAITLIPTLAPPPPTTVLVAGLTKSVQGFDALPAVENEIREIRAIYSGESLKDETFRLSTIRNDLGASGYSVAHLATHGEFSSDHRRSFILTYDDKLTMDGLQKALGVRQDPLDLLVLSACSTAAGDDRAALGLAGVAIQSGAKSALASLWSISDQATAELMNDFYKSRRDGKSTKAASLRDAQLALLRQPSFRHPSYWAPYLMIGNWL